MLYGIPLTPRNIVCGILFCASMLLFAVSFVLLGRAKQHRKPGHFYTSMAFADPRDLNKQGQQLLEQGQRVIAVAISLFVVFAIMALVWH